MRGRKLTTVQSDLELIDHQLAFLVAIPPETVADLGEQKDSMPLRFQFR